MEPPAPSTGQATEQIVEAIQSLRSVSAHNYFISNFDPNLHDVEAWFSEVDRAKIANRWDDYECLSYRKLAYRKLSERGLQSLA